MSTILEPPQGSGALRNVPEPRDLKACLSNLERSFLLSPPPYIVVVEQVFSALFYNHLWTDLWMATLQKWLGEPLIHTVTYTPFRKYKASLPWLSLACQPSVALDCLCAEMLFSLFYLLDDIYDKKTRRYGKDTAYGLYGAGRNRDSLNRAYNFDKWSPLFQGDSERAGLWLDSLNQIEASEKQHLAYHEAFPYTTYCEQSIERTSFLGKWWKRAAIVAQDRELNRVIDRIYSACALMGQIRNDLRNIDEREESEGGVQFSDFTDGRTTAVTILVREQSSGRERSWLQNVIWNHPNKRLSPDEKILLQCLCKETRQYLTDQIIRDVQRVEQEIERSQLSEDVKALWLGWIFRQFCTEVISNQPENLLAIRRFIEAVRRLSKDAQEIPLPNGIPTSTRAF